MKISKGRIHSISAAILDRLSKDKLIEIRTAKEDLLRKIEETMTEELAVEERLNQEIREILKSYQDEIDKGNLDYRKMFVMMKNKLVKERELIL